MWGGRLRFELLCYCFICINLSIDGQAVGMVVGQGGIDTVKGQMGILTRNFFGAMAQFVPNGDAMDRDASPCDARSTVANVRGAGDEGVEKSAHDVTQGVAIAILALVF
jgi:hypothetical protein